jgi:hypothetical protein
MGKKITQFIIVALVCGLCYFLLNQHIIFYTGGEEKKITLLEKSTLTLNDTFVSLETGEYGSFETILKTGTLREDGLGRILVEWELLTEEELSKIEQKIDSEE